MIYLTLKSSVKFRIITTFIFKIVFHLKSCQFSIVMCNLYLLKLLYCYLRVLAFNFITPHITPVLQNLHWLPVPQRIQFKILLLTHKALHNQARPTSLTCSIATIHPAASVHLMLTTLLFHSEPSAEPEATEPSLQLPPPSGTLSPNTSVTVLTQISGKNKPF